MLKGMSVPSKSQRKSPVGYYSSMFPSMDFENTLTAGVFLCRRLESKKKGSRWVTESSITGGGRNEHRDELFDLSGKPI